MKKLLFITGLSLLVTGCRPQSAAELRTDHYQHTQFEVSAPYETVYQRLHEQARLNFYGQFMGSRYRVENNLYSQRQAANVSMYVETQMRHAMLVTMDISRINDNQTRVDVYRVRDAFAEKFAREAPKWATRDNY